MKANILRDEAVTLLKELIPFGDRKIDRIVACICKSVEMEIVERLQEKLIKKGSGDGRNTK